MKLDWKVDESKQERLLKVRVRRQDIFYLSFLLFFGRVSLLPNCSAPPPPPKPPFFRPPPPPPQSIFKGSDWPLSRDVNNYCCTLFFFSVFNFVAEDSSPMLVSGDKTGWEGGELYNAEQVRINTSYKYVCLEWVSMSDINICSLHKSFCSPVESQFLEPPRETKIAENWFEKSGFRNIGGTITVKRIQGKRFWFELSGVLRNRWFEKLGFHSVLYF